MGYNGRKLEINFTAAGSRVASILYSICIAPVNNKKAVTEKVCNCL